MEFLFQDANSSAFVEKNRVGSGSSAYLAAQQVTYDFADWVNVIKGLSLHEDRLLDFDQASLFTRYDLQTNFAIVKAQKWGLVAHW